jgi:hypothetical protein
VIPKEQWEWFGYAGHFICADWCKFRMCTKVGDFLVSTVGDYHMPIRGEEQGPRKTIGAGDDAFFETYVFNAGPRCSAKGCDCGQPTIDGSEIDGERCATAGEAQKLHMAKCLEYSTVDGDCDATR